MTSLSFSLVVTWHHILAGKRNLHLHVSLMQEYHLFIYMHNCLYMFSIYLAHALVHCVIMFHPFFPGFSIFPGISAAWVAVSTSMPSLRENCARTPANRPEAVRPELFHPVFKPPMARASYDVSIICWWYHLFWSKAFKRQFGHQSCLALELDSARSNVTKYRQFRAAYFSRSYLFFLMFFHCFFFKQFVQATCIHVPAS